MRSALQINIKILRVYLEVTASGLGAISGTSLITIQNAETCNNISGKTLRKLGETTGIEPLSLFQDAPLSYYGWTEPYTRHSFEKWYDQGRVPTEEQEKHRKRALNKQTFDFPTEKIGLQCQQFY